MEKSLFEQMGGSYTQQGDYFFPDLKLPEDENKSIGVWGQRHLRYIRRYKRRQPFCYKAVSINIAKMIGLCYDNSNLLKGE
ncbi:MAG: TnpV protein [Lachnospiraceae bacterium]|nr:TnpV protein [Lachnospiraceae bacterium]